MTLELQLTQRHQAPPTHLRSVISIRVAFWVTFRLDSAVRCLSNVDCQSIID